MTKRNRPLHGISTSGIRLQQSAKASFYSCQSPACCPDIKGSGCTHHDTPYKPALMLIWFRCLMRNFRHNDIPGLEPEEILFSAGPFRDDDPALIQCTTEPGTTACGFGIQVVPVRSVMIALFRDCPDTEGIIMMLLGISQFCTVIFCPAATGAFHIPEDLEQMVFQIPPGGRHPRSIAHGLSLRFPIDDFLDQLDPFAV